MPQSCHKVTDHGRKGTAGTQKIDQPFQESTDSTWPVQGSNRQKPYRQSEIHFLGRDASCKRQLCNIYSEGKHFPERARRQIVNEIIVLVALLRHCARWLRDAPIH